MKTTPTQHLQKELAQGRADMERLKNVTLWVKEIASSGGIVPDSWTHCNAEGLDTVCIGNPSWRSRRLILIIESCLKGQQAGLCLSGVEVTTSHKLLLSSGRGFRRSFAYSVDWKECCERGQCHNINWAPGRKS